MATNKMPEVLNDFRAYDENQTNMLGIASVEYPSISNITQTVKGTGVGGEVDATVLGQFESMETKINWNTPTKYNLRFMGGKPVALEFRGAVQNWDSGENRYVWDNIRVIIRGRAKNGEPGKWEPANTTDATNTIETTYFKYEVNNETMIEIDKYACKCVIDGVDLTAELREALGI